MEKSPDAFRTISEVADAMGLPQHVLRFWETRFPQIKPLKRAGGRRYYRPDDIERLRLIKHLLYDEGYTIKGVQKLLKEQGAAALAAASGASILSPLSDAADEKALAVAGASGDDDTPNAAARGGDGGLTAADAGALREALADLVEARRILSLPRV
jgi:DNA-binding transcriptional MerR regulator